MILEFAEKGNEIYAKPRSATLQAMKATTPERNVRNHMTDDVRKYAAEQGITEEDVLKKGTEEKSRAFTEKGSGLYAKAEGQMNHFQPRGTNSSHEQASALRILATVVMSTFISPASIRRTLRALMSTNSASRSCVMSKDVRMRRILPPNSRRSLAILLLDTQH